MISTCPMAVVEAPADVVFARIVDPNRLDEWWDARTATVEPPGPMQPGQHITATTVGFGRTWTVTFDVIAVDAPARQVVLVAHLPLGITDRATLTCTPLDDRRTQLSLS